MGSLGSTLFFGSGKSKILLIRNACRRWTLMAITLSAIIPILEAIAPPCLAEEWDNVGLQIGDPHGEVTYIWVALDPSLGVVTAACEAGVDLLVTHHPLFFRPVKRIDVQRPSGKIVEQAIRHHLAIFSMHTNLDATRDGLNDWLARQLGLIRLRPLVAHAGMARRQRDGIGRVGTLPTATELGNLALDVKRRLGIGTVRIAGDASLRVKRVALSTGSGGSLLDHFLASDAEAYISGDLRYHEARDIEASRRGLVDIGHFHSEHLMADTLAKRLRRVLSSHHARIRVEPCSMERDPFSFV